jgi:hypothetical protein
LTNGARIGGDDVPTGLLLPVVRGLWIRTLVTGVIGALGGLLLYAAGHIGGRILFTALGTAIGVGASLVFQIYERAVRLTEITLNVPQLSQLTFVINNDSRQVAWKIFVEIVTRVATQPLESQSGLLREALASLHGLFSVTRELLKNSQPSRPSSGQTVESLALGMLNSVLRPFLSKWHPRLLEYERADPGARPSDWPENDSCRADLVLVQSQLRQYARGFAQLAGVANAEIMIDGAS